MKYYILIVLSCLLCGSMNIQANASYKQEYTSQEVNFIESSMDMIRINKISEVIGLISKIVSKKNISHELYEKVLLFLENKYIPAINSKLITEGGKKTLKETREVLIWARTLIQAYHAGIKGDFISCENIIQQTQQSGIALHWTLPQSDWVIGYVYNHKKGLTALQSNSILFDDFCIKQKAIQTKDKFVCEGIKNVESKNQCYLLYAINVGDVRDCDLTTMSSDCKQYFQVMSPPDSKASICKEAYSNDQNALLNCFKQSYEKIQNNLLGECWKQYESHSFMWSLCGEKEYNKLPGLSASDCDVFSNPSEKKSCLFMTISGIEACKYSDGMPTMCENNRYQSEAFKNKDVALCKKIIPNNSFDSRNYCVTSIAKLNKDPNTCHVIDSFTSIDGRKGMESSCKSEVTLFVGIADKNPEVCTQYITRKPQIEVCKQEINRGIALNKAQSPTKAEDCIVLDDDYDDEKNQCFIKLMKQINKWNYCDQLTGPKKYECIAYKEIQN